MVDAPADAFFQFAREIPPGPLAYAALMPDFFPLAIEQGFHLAFASLRALSNRSLYANGANVFRVCAFDLCRCRTRGPFGKQAFNCQTMGTFSLNATDIPESRGCSSFAMMELKRRSPN
jgi:hypothetical protein